MRYRAVQETAINTRHPHAHRLCRVNLGKANAATQSRNFRNANLASLLAQTSDLKEQANLLRNSAVAVLQLFAHILEVSLGLRCRQLTVRLQAQLLRRNIRIGNRGRNGKVDRHRLLFLLLRMLELLDSLADHANVEVETHALNMARLFSAQQVTRTTQLQIAQSNVITRAQSRVLSDGCQAIMRLLSHRMLRVVEEVGVSALTGAAHTSTKLVQLRQAIALRVVDDERIRVGNIQARLNNRCAQQHVNLAVPKIANHRIQLFLTHLAVANANARFGDELMQLGSHLVDITHAVVHVEHLASAQQLAANGSHHLRILIGSHIGEHWQAVLWRGGKSRHLANARQRHLQRARNRGCGHGKHVNVGLQSLERLLMFHAKALLLVDNHQAKLFELDLGVEQLMRADHHVNCAFAQRFQGFLGRCRRLEARQRLDGDRETGETFAEGFKVLLNEQGGRHENSHLVTVHHCLESCSQCDFCFSKAHVSGEQAVHGSRRLHILLDFVDRAQLVRRLLVGEGIFHLSLPWGVGREGVAFDARACRVELDQVGGDFAHMLLGFSFRFCPVGTAKFVEFRLLGAKILGDEVQLVGRYEQVVSWSPSSARRVFEDDVFAVGFHCSRADGSLLELDEFGDTVLLVDDVIAWFQVDEVDVVASSARRLVA